MVLLLAELFFSFLFVKCKKYELQSIQKKYKTVAEVSVNVLVLFKLQLNRWTKHSHILIVAMTTSAYCRRPHIYTY